MIDERPSWNGETLPSAFNYMGTAIVQIPRLLSPM